MPKKVTLTTKKLTPGFNKKEKKIENFVVVTIPLPSKNQDLWPLTNHKYSALHNNPSYFRILIDSCL